MSLFVSNITTNIFLYMACVEMWWPLIGQFTLTRYTGTGNDSLTTR